MKKRFLFCTIFAMLLIALIILNPSKVLAENGPSDLYCYLIFYNDEGSKEVYRPNSVNNNAQTGATYDKSTNTLTLNNYLSRRITNNGKL